jgi:FtsZ-interacting cell division protein ZipA
VWDVIKKRGANKLFYEQDARQDDHEQLLAGNHNPAGTHNNHLLQNVGKNIGNSIGGGIGKNISDNISKHLQPRVKSVIAAATASREDNDDLFDSSFLDSDINTAINSAGINSGINASSIHVPSNIGITNVTTSRINNTIKSIKPISTISISIIAKHNNLFAGTKLLEAIDAVSMVYGSMNIFHRYQYDDGSGNYLFSLASAIEPGCFNKTQMSVQNFTGITLFFNVNDVKSAEDSLDNMLKIAKQLSFRLNGDLQDKDHKPLTINQIEEYREALKQIANL